MSDLDVIVNKINKGVKEGKVEIKFLKRTKTKKGNSGKKINIKFLNDNQEEEVNYILTVNPNFNNGFIQPSFDLICNPSLTYKKSSRQKFSIRKEETDINKINAFKKLIKLTINKNITIRKKALGCTLAAASIYADSKDLQPVPIPYFTWKNSSNIKEKIETIL